MMIGSSLLSVFMTTKNPENSITSSDLLRKITQFEGDILEI